MVPGMHGSVNRTLQHLMFDGVHLEQHAFWREFQIPNVIAINMFQYYLSEVKKAATEHYHHMNICFLRILVTKHIIVISPCESGDT